MSDVLYENIKTASRMKEGVIVSFSGGKDSVVTLDLCCRYFKRVEVFFMYLVKGLSFQEALLRWYERKYELSIYRLPHFMLSEWLALGTFRIPDLEVPIITPSDIYTYVRDQTGIQWIAGGERIKDSIWRRVMMVKSGSIDLKRGRIYPVAHWSKAEILTYIQRRRLKLSPESAVLGHSFRSLMPLEVKAIRDHYPADYARIERWFPFVEATIKQYEYANERKAEENGQRAEDAVPEVRDQIDLPGSDPGSPIQSQGN